MNIAITGRHMETSDALRAYIKTALSKVETHFDKISEATVVLDVQKHRHIAEINLHANGIRINGRESTQDMYASVDAVISKLEKQIRKFKERIIRHKPRASIKDQSYDYAVIAMDQTPVENQAEPAWHHKVVMREKVPMNPMSMDEAVMQLELVDDPFLVFTNAETSQLNVLYARDDETYGLIEPKF
jgi:putative sigma-54 modulation protein